MKINLLFLTLIPFLVSCHQKPLPPTNSANLDAYNALVEKFESNSYRADVNSYVATGFRNGATVFVGSSTFTIWHQAETIFAEYNVINRGIGGSTIKNIIAHSENLIFANNPRIVVLYIGDNDVYQIDIKDFKYYLSCFILNFRHRFSKSDLVLLSLKPSPSRKLKHNAYMEINKTYKQYDQLDERISYVDIWSPLSIQSSQYFYDDLHLNEKGYRIVVDSLTPVLKRILAK